MPPIQALSYSAGMSPEDIAKDLQTQPFHPFRIYLSDGTGFNITHPDLVLVSKSALDIGEPSKPGSKVMERIVRCALPHVVKLDPQLS